MLTHFGNDREKITCVGHSLGAHICGMISNHISHKQHRIVGLDPAKPLVQMSKPPSFRLTADDADHTQVIHTNAGILGQDDSNVDLHFCVNGGRFQPYCKGNPIRRSRCSHFLSICFLANAMLKSKEFIGVPCEQCVEISGPGRLPVFYNDPYKTIQLTKKFRIGNDAPLGWVSSNAIIFQILIGVFFLQLQWNFLHRCSLCQTLSFWGLKIYVELELSGDCSKTLLITFIYFSNFEGVFIFWGLILRSLF